MEKGSDHDVQVSSENDYDEEIITSHDEVRRGPWTVDEDFTLINYIAHHGEGRWNSLSRCAGLKRTGKSCRLRWLNYLRPDVRRGNITLEEQLLILELHSRWGNRWSKIAQHLPGRTDNEIKNYWRTRVQKHAKQLKCDVNSKQFKDTMRYLWMPRLVERIQAASSAAPAADHHRIISTSGGLPMPENSSAAASSESFGTPASDLTESYNNYPIINNNNNQDCCNYYPDHHQQQVAYNGGEIDDQKIDQNQTLTSPSGYFDQFGFMTEQQNNNNNNNINNNNSSSSNQWMDGGDVSDGLWNDDDMWFLQHQFNANF